MNFRKVNNITGWIVCAIASITYILTREATASLWDTGEFIASAYKLQLPHPPGAPTFLLLGRVFIIFFGSNNPASAVNLLSALASGFTILFLFWTITHFARKMFVNVGEHLTGQQLVTVMGAGVVGALAYTFSDSFWFSAVEGEVYSLSSFFTAVVFWAMLKWEHASELALDDAGAKYRADRWIVFIFFMIGLSIGVHLLSLLTIPAIVMIYYFKRYKPTKRGPFLAFLMACVITGVVQVVAIKYSVKIAGLFDIWFVNGFNMPFFSGFIFFFILLGFLIWLSIRLAERRGWTFLRLGLWCLIFMLIGYSTYVTTLVRSNANPAIDMNNVDNPMSLVYYLGREQYGEAPLIYGPHFQADYEYKDDGYVKVKEGEMKYTKGKDKYIPIGKDQQPVYSSEDMQLLPRVWDPSNEQQHAAFYAQWLNLGQYNDPQTGQTKYDDPTYADNINWFFTYQMGLMYWRYFMWNFAGKQNDIQGFGNKRDGNWISGFSFIDNQRLGDQSKLPDSIKNNKAHNRLFLLPYILGVLGCIFQFLKNRKDWVVTFLLFAMTGLAVVFYLNQPGNQPRERDYAFVGSFYGFAVWIGLAVVGIFRLAREVADKKAFTNTLLYGGITTVVITGLSCIYGAGGVLPSLITGVIYAAVAGGIIYLVRAFSSKGQNVRIANITTIAICMIVPVLMAMQEWDDHDRSRKTIARDIATDYLESCAPNAILFTFGDNDTYPLWYVQEVEGVRPDIRIINNSLLGIDWYINQLRYKINQSDPIDVLWEPALLEGRKREYVRYAADPRVSKETFYPLEDVMRNVLGKDDPSNPSGINSFPVKRFKVPVDTALARQYGVSIGNDSTLTNMAFEIPEAKNVLLRNELIILNIIAANKWKRPIYFTSPYGELGFGQYIRKDGLSYRLVPIKNNFPQNKWIVDQTIRQTGLGGTSIRDMNTNWVSKVLMEKFKFGGVDKPGMYFDEENRRHLLSIRETYGEAAGILADENRKDEANKLLQKCESMMRQDNMPYAMVSRFNQHNQTALIYLEGCYKTGNLELADKVRKSTRKDLEQQKKYFDYLKTEREELFKSFGYEGEINDALLFVLDQVEKKYAPQTQLKPIIEGNNQPIINKAADSGINLPKKDSNPK